MSGGIYRAGLDHSAGAFFIFVLAVRPTEEWEEDLMGLCRLLCAVEVTGLNCFSTIMVHPVLQATS